MVIVQLSFDVVTRTALSVTVLFHRIFRIWIASLDHELFDDPVENGGVVETLARQFLEILDRVWCSISPKLDHHVTFACFDYGHFVWCVHRFVLFSVDIRGAQRQAYKAAQRQFHPATITLNAQRSTLNAQRSTLNDKTKQRASLPSLNVGRWMLDVGCCRQPRRGIPANCAPELFVFVTTGFRSRRPARRAPLS